MKIEKEHVIQYEKIRQSGKFNMIMDALKVSKSMGLNIYDYMHIIENYFWFIKKYNVKQ